MNEQWMDINSIYQYRILCGNVFFFYPRMLLSVAVCVRYECVIIIQYSMHNAHKILCAATVHRYSFFHSSRNSDGNLRCLSLHSTRWNLIKIRMKMETETQAASSVGPVSSVHIVQIQITDCIHCTSIKCKHWSHYYSFVCSLRIENKNNKNDFHCL